MRKTIKLYHSTHTGAINWSEPTTTRDEFNIQVPPKNYVYISNAAIKTLRYKLRGTRKRKNFKYHYYYLLSTIHHLTYVDRRYKRLKYKPINRAIMCGIISKRMYDEIVSNLIDWGIIERDTSYLVGEYSKGFRLLEPYDRDFKKVEIEDQLMNQKLNDFKQSGSRNINDLPQQYHYIEMTNTCIEMDYQKAYSYNDQKYFNASDISVYESNYYAIGAYEDRHYRFSVDRAGNRAHTNLTNLKSDLRPFITVDGEGLGQVDISNSQPLFLSMSLNQEPTIPSDEKAIFFQLVESGQLYEYFIDKLGYSPDQREEVKKKVFAEVMYGRYRPIEKSPLMRVFNQDFPHITAHIMELRRHDHAELPKRLQKTESKFIIEGVVGDFISRYGHQNEFISTIHDSIVVKARMLDEAEKIMRKRFERRGIRPNLKVNVFR